MAGDGTGRGGHRGGSPEMAEVMGVGLQFAGAIVLFLFIGRWLDARLGTTPWLLILGVMVGAGGGFYSMYRRLVIVPREKARKEEGR